MRKLILLFGLLTVFSFTALAKHVDELTAKKAGQNFILTSSNSLELRSSQNFNLVYTSKSSNVFDEPDTEQITFFYVFNIDTKGFVIVSADDNVLPILAYSSEGTFDSNNIPQNVMKWLEDYKNQIRYVVENNIEAPLQIQENWQKLLSSKQIETVIEKSFVNPLIATKWNQAPYYNALCPNGTVTGCVATAMAQVMKYWNYPTSGTGFHSYNHPTYGTLSANFGSTTYQWSSMPNSINSPNSAIATLMYHCGVSVDMNYGPASTGGSSATYSAAEYALKNYFGYKNTLNLVVRSDYNQNQWLNLLKAELDASRPILYAGSGNGGGHAFVCDGYDNNNLFHFNWGWGGNSDGYFQIDALNPGSLGAGGGDGGFNYNQHAIIGIQTPSGQAPENYDLQLYSNITMSSTQIWFTTAFDLTVDIANYGTNSFSGDYGAAIFDEDLNFMDFMEVKTGMTLNSNSHYSTPLNFSNPGSASFVPGTYYVAIFYKTSTKGWTIIGDDNYNNIKQFKIIYSSDNIETNSDFTITNNGGKLTQGSNASVNVNILNTSSTTFTGQYRVRLSSLDGTQVQTIQTLNENNGLPSNYTYTNGVDFSGTITVEPGTYLMYLSYQKQGTTGWYYAGSTDYSNPIYVIVEAPTIQPDAYEVNNTINQSYTLPLSFSNNIASKTTVGSNLHIGTDKDYYKINLPSGYNYTITARLHDSYNSGNGNSYTVDGVVSYSKNGSTWSDAYDDIIQGNITIQNGGTVYFLVAPYFSGETGTYLLDLKVTREAISTTGIDEIDVLNNIKLYPNPANTHAYIDLKDSNCEINRISILNLNGQTVNSINHISNKEVIELPIQGLSNGIYLINVESKQGMATKKLIINK